jgi:hypothetical protein
MNIKREIREVKEKRGDRPPLLSPFECRVIYGKKI